ncbi:hypothetical protein BDQ94DRAFT_163309 [Aspergillus welwitschiae]|uniref:Uncharacterized protein n=1 Tax=Aspergillus welwitschiae TaxID=1341132 RepID=A0A3F3PLZ0_9EURO|nr:hypothetical protein BDQ94DRAFT_163309 [Aspergillus welwitschiae]RDH27853.1 hypothetical protein BDQ94DRAFT_163309 [Aspergillus welwitschiae]
MSGAQPFLPFSILTLRSIPEKPDLNPQLGQKIIQLAYVAKRTVRSKFQKRWVNQCTASHTAVGTGDRPYLIESRATGVLPLPAATEADVKSDPDFNLGQKHLDPWAIEADSNWWATCDTRLILHLVSPCSAEALTVCRYTAWHYLNVSDTLRDIMGYGVLGHTLASVHLDSEAPEQLASCIPSSISHGLQYFLLGSCTNDAGGQISNVMRSATRRKVDYGEECLGLQNVLLAIMTARWWAYKEAGAHNSARLFEPVRKAGVVSPIVLL